MDKKQHRKEQERQRVIIGLCVLIIAVAAIIFFVVTRSKGKSDAEDKQQNAGADQTMEATEIVAATEEIPETETEVKEAGNVGMILNNPEISDVSSLSGETVDWGQGTIVDDLNRPTGCAMFQSKYSAFPADFIIETEEKEIYLTFDEGYEYGYTPSILETLKEKGVTAVFFLTKPFAETEPELVQAMIDGGHVIGNHSVTHPSAGLPSQTLEQQENELMENHRYVKENYNYDMFLFRFPAGKFSEQSLAVVNNCGYRSVFWSFAHMDYDVENQPDAAASLQKMMDMLHPGAIYLLHGVSKTNAEVLGDFIDQARAAGYTFKSYADAQSLQ